MTHTTTYVAARRTGTLFGVLAGLGGITHGIGEVLQGNVKPNGLIIDSWTQGPIATNMGGEPGMTVVPNLRLTGILTILVSLAVIVTASRLRDRRGGRALLLLSTLMMLVGGGFGPPVLGILAGVAGTGIDKPPAWGETRRAPAVARRLGPLWPWIYALTAANGIFLVVGLGCPRLRLRREQRGPLHEQLLPVRRLAGGDHHPRQAVRPSTVLTLAA